MIRILLTGGGTGGHIYPLIAVAEELKNIATEKNMNLTLRYFGAPGDFENILLANQIRVSRILSAKLRRYFDPRNLLDVPKFFMSLLQSLCKIFFYMPDVVFSKGGPGALAIVLAARFYRIPVMIHDSDAVPGLTNQISSKFAERVAISFEGAAEYVFGSIALTGNPIRRKLTEDIPEVETAKTILGFSHTKPLILFINGSQGATRVNDFILDTAKELLRDFQILHQTGTHHFEVVRKELEIAGRDFSEEEKQNYKIVPYFDDNIKTAYSAADVIVSRAGSGSIFEIAAFGKPSILIPLPEAADQPKNAYAYAHTGAAIIIESENLTPNILINELKKIISDPTRQEAMSEAARKFSKPGAAKMVAEEILKLV